MKADTRGTIAVMLLLFLATCTYLPTSLTSDGLTAAWDVPNSSCIDWAMLGFRAALFAIGGTMLIFFAGWDEESPEEKPKDLSAVSQGVEQQ